MAGLTRYQSNRDHRFCAANLSAYIDDALDRRACEWMRPHASAAFLSPVPCVGSRRCAWAWEVLYDDGRAAVCDRSHTTAVVSRGMNFVVCLAPLRGADTSQGRAELASFVMMLALGGV